MLLVADSPTVAASASALQPQSFPHPRLSVAVLPLLLQAAVLAVVQMQTNSSPLHDIHQKPWLQHQGRSEGAVDVLPCSPLQDTVAQGCARLCGEAAAHLHNSLQCLCAFIEALLKQQQGAQ